MARALSFARYLPLQGWQVTVLCADPASAPLRDPTRDTRLPEGVEVIPVPMPAGLHQSRRAILGTGARPSGLFRLARRLSSWIFVPDSYAPWRGPATRAALARLGRGDIEMVLTSSPPDTVHLVGLDVKRRYGLPWVVDFRDPWVGLTYKRPPSPWHAARQRKLRAEVVSSADLLMATTRASAEELARLAPARPVRVLPNGWEDDARVEGPRDDRRSSGPAPIRVVYTGTLWDVPATRTCLAGLARALGSATDRKPPLELLVAGPFESGERQVAQSLGLDGVVHFHGQVPYDRSRTLQVSADVLLLLQVHGPGYEGAIPGKLYEYIASDRPILAFLEEGEAAQMVRDIGGWVVGPEDVAAARKAFERLLAGERPAADSDRRRRVKELHRRDKLVGELGRDLADWIDRPGAMAAPAEPGR